MVVLNWHLQSKLAGRSATCISECRRAGKNTIPTLSHYKASFFIKIARIFQSRQSEPRKIDELWSAPGLTPFRDHQQETLFPAVFHADEFICICCAAFTKRHVYTELLKTFMLWAFDPTGLLLLSDSGIWSVRSWQQSRYLSVVLLHLPYSYIYASTAGNVNAVLATARRLRQQTQKRYKLSKKRHKDYLIMPQALMKNIRR